ncbi:MAG: hypothetical protein ACE5L7_11585 [Candidatus Aminicenantales bacterium]
MTPAFSEDMLELLSICKFLRTEKKKLHQDECRNSDDYFLSHFDTREGEILLLWYITRDICRVKRTIIILQNHPILRPIPLFLFSLPGMFIAPKWTRGKSNQTQNSQIFHFSVYEKIKRRGK